MPTKEYTPEEAAALRKLVHDSELERRAKDAKKASDARKLALFDKLVAIASETLGWLKSEGVAARLKGTWPMADERRELIDHLAAALAAAENCR